IGTPILLAWILLHRPRPLARTRQTLLRTVALAVGISVAAVAVTGGLASVLPPMILGPRFTEFNTLLQAVPFLVVAFAAAVYRQGRCPERRIEASVIAGLVLVTVETMMFMFMRARYDGFWYVGHALMVLPCVALLVGTVGLYVAARHEADVQLRVMERLKESQRHLQVIIDTSPSAVITADEKGIITGWNRKAEEIFGWSHDEAIGRTLAGTIIPRRYREAHQRGLNRFIETGERKLLAGPVGEFWAVDQEANVLRLASGWYRPSRDFAAFEASGRDVTFARGVGLLGRVWATGRARSIDEVASDPNSQRAVEAARSGLHAQFAFAVTNGRKVIGVIALFSNE